MKTTRIGLINLLVTLMLIVGVLIFPSRSTASTGNTTSDLQITPISYQMVGSDYVEVLANMSGNLQREDGSQGSYKVQVSLLYPTGAEACNGVGILDMINSVFYETFEFVGTQGDPFFPSLFPLARMNLGDAFIQDRGYDLRTFIIGDRVVAQYARYNPNQLLKNIHLGAESKSLQEMKRIDPKIFDFAKISEKIALEISKIAELDIIGVDTLPSKDGQVYLIEWNSVPGFRGAEEATQLNIAGEIIRYYFNK